LVPSHKRPTARFGIWGRAYAAKVFLSVRVLRSAIVEHGAGDEDQMVVWLDSSGRRKVTIFPSNARPLRLSGVEIGGAGKDEFVLKIGGR
jgi:hypothetical protein